MNSLLPINGGFDQVHELIESKYEGETKYLAVKNGEKGILGNPDNVDEEEFDSLQIHSDSFALEYVPGRLQQIKYSEDKDSDIEFFEELRAL